MINLKFEEKKAYLPKKNGRRFKSVELGTKEGESILRDSKILSYAVECDPTFFIMTRQKNGRWIAKDENNPSVKFDMGKSGEINFQTFLDALNFLSQKSKS